MRAFLVTCLAVSLAACTSAPKILDPRLSAATPAGGATPARPGLDDAPWPLNPDSCWPDCIIRPPKK